MSLNTAQRATLLADISGNPTRAAQLAAGDDSTLANYYNEATTTDLWRPNVTRQELVDCIDWDPDWQALNNDAARRDAWQELTEPGTINATQTRIRDGFVYIFQNAGQTGGTLGRMVAVAKRKGTRLEVLLSVADGAANVTEVFGYQITPQEISTLR